MAFELPVGSKFLPQQDELWCRMYVETETIAGSKLIKPDVSRRACFMARVESVGPGKLIDINEGGNPIRMTMTYEPGDDILFSRFHGEPVNIGEEQFIVLKQNDVLGKVEIPKKLQNKTFKLAVAGDNGSLEERRTIPDNG
jgi:chaperonin GroES